MTTPTERHQQVRRTAGIVLTEDRLAVLEEAIAGATGQNVEELRAKARQRAQDRRPSR